MTTAEIQEVEQKIPFFVDENLVDQEGGAGYMLLRWLNANTDDIPPYWSPARDRWLRQFVYGNGPIKTAVNTFVNKVVTIPWSVQARDRSISRHVTNAGALEEVLRRMAGSMSSRALAGFKNTFKMFTKDYLTQDNGSFMVVMGNGRADGPIVGAPSGILHLDAALCTRTKDPEFPVKYRNAGRGGDSKEYKLHYTRVVEMANLPAGEVDLNGVGLCPVSCCIEAAQELYSIYRYNEEMFGSKPPRQILYAKKGASLKTIQDAVDAWQGKMLAGNRTRFGGTLFMAPRQMGQELELDVLYLSTMPEDFNRRDVTTIDKSEIAAAFGLDLRDLAYVMGAPSRTGDAEVQDKKGRGKGVGEFIETFVERMEEVYLNKKLYALEFDNFDDDQDEQEADIRDKRSAGRERDLRAAVTNIRVERERMWEHGEITYEQFCEMELADGRLPDGLDVLLLFQSEDKDYREWLDLGVSDPTNIAKNDAMKMADKIHEQFIEVSRLIYEETRSERKRKATQALAALDKLRSMYQVPEGQAITDAATLEAADAGQAGGVDPTAASTAAPATAPAQKPENEERPAATSKESSLAGVLRPHTTGDHGQKQLYMGDDPDIQQYERQFAALAEQAIEGEISRERFEGAMGQIVASILISMFLKGGRLTYSELTEEARAALTLVINDHINSLENFVGDIYMGRYAPENLGLQGAFDRVGMWLNIASGIIFLGQLYRPDNPYLRWNFSVFKEHCADCVRLDGQVHTAQEWRASGLYPRYFGLACAGVRCGCYFTEVSGPSTGAF